jgi:Lipase (class 3)
VLIAGPDTKVVELRVHGVMGTTPEALVDAVLTVDVAGDGVGRIVRPADRLRRPAPGPVLQAGGRPIPRTIEGYVWSGMTSGGLAKATWALLLPFSLANVAHWMLPRTNRVFGGALRALIRLAALALTMLLITQVTVVSLDLLAVQWLSGLGLDQFEQLRAWRGPIGMLPVILVIAVLHQLSSIDWRVSVKDAAPHGHLLPGSRVIADPDAPALHAVHGTAGLATAALLAVGGPLHPAAPGVVAVVWVAALALLGLSALIITLLDAPGEGRWFRPVLRRALTAAALVVAVAASVVAPMPAGVRHLPGTDQTVQVVAAVLALTCIVFALLLIPVALLARRKWSGLPSNLRPWAGGWMAAPVLIIAGLLGGGFGAGIGITVQQAIRNVPLELPEGYRYVTTLWGAAAVLAVVVGLIGAIAVVVPRHAAAIELGLLHTEKPEEAKRATKAWRRAQLERNHLHRLILGAAAVLSVGAVVSVAMQVRNVPLPVWAQPLPVIGVTGLGVLAVGLLRMVYLASKRPDTARHLGVLSDLACFWPREAHPIVPPCYALKVVPEVVARVAEHLREPGTRVVLTGHSQGSLLAAVAAARLLDSLPEADRERIGLVTVGSPLQWAYPRAFPSVVSHSSLTELSGKLDGRWRALCRGTDPLGGAVTTWGRQMFHGQLLGVGFDGPLPPAVRSPHGAYVLGGDHWLPDPQHGPIPGRRWRPGVLQHRDYTSDPEWDRAVALAAGLDVTEVKPFGYKG